MKRNIISALLVIAMAFSLAGCGTKNGNTRNAAISFVKSDMYTTDEQAKSIYAAEKYFEENFTDCTLNEIQYMGDKEMKAKFSDDCKAFGTENVMVLTSKFKTGSHPVESFTSNCTYNDWHWIMVKNEDGEWQNQGYGMC